MSLCAVKALSSTRFGINLCNAGFIQHSSDSPAEPSLLEQDGKTKREAARKACSLQRAPHGCWSLSGLKRVYRLCPKCPDKIGAPECVVLRTFAAVYLRAEKLSKVPRPSAPTPWLRADDRHRRYPTAFVPRGDTAAAENPKAQPELLSGVC